MKKDENANHMLRKDNVVQGRRSGICDSVNTQQLQRQLEKHQRGGSTDSEGEGLSYKTDKELADAKAANEQQILRSEKRNPPIKQAGHVGALLFDHSGERLLKYVDEEEFRENLKVIARQESRPDDRVFPIIYNAICPLERVENDFLNLYGDGAKTKKFLIEYLKKTGKKPLIEMQNISSLGKCDLILDFKIGTQTAMSSELQTNHNKSKFAANYKELKHRHGHDHGSGTTVFGIRCENLWKMHRKSKCLPNAKCQPTCRIINFF